MVTRILAIPLESHYVRVVRRDLATSQNPVDMVAVGRAMLSNPDWANRVRTGDTAELAPYDEKALTSHWYRLTSTWQAACRCPLPRGCDRMVSRSLASSLVGSGTLWAAPADFMTVLLEEN